MFGTSFNQMQSWPTPEIFVSVSRDREYSEAANAGCSLESLSFYEPVDGGEQAEQFTAGMAIESVVYPGPVTAPDQTEAALAGMALQSLFLIEAVTETQTEGAAPHVAVESVFYYEPVTVEIDAGSSTPETPVTAGMSLESCVL